MKKQIKTTLLSLSALLLLNSSLSANSLNIPQPKAKKVKTTKKYENGWWWYEEKYKDPVKKKEVIVKYKLSPLEKAKLDREENTNKLLKILITEQKETQKLNKKILERLNYAFPNTTPKYATNSKGKKCLTNSSADCFVMPVIAEGQHVPVLKNFLRNPSPKNSKEWLKWQAKYFNHISKISHGLRFAFLNGGSDVYDTPTTYTYGDNLFFSKSEAAQGAREAKIIHKLKNKIAYLIFLGQNEAFEKLTNVYKHFSQYNKTFLKDMNMVIVFPDKEAETRIMRNVVADLKQQGYKQPVEFFKNVKKAIRPDLYKQYNIKVTPSVVLFYEDTKGKKRLSQTIAVGEISVYRLRTGTMNFLKYNDIIKPGEMAADKNWNTPEKPVLKKLIKIPNPKKPLDFDKIDKKLQKLEIEDKQGE